MPLARRNARLSEVAKDWAMQLVSWADIHPAREADVC